MHEVALSHQLASVVSRAAAGRCVVGVRLEVGALRQVVPETLQWAWQFVAPTRGLDPVELTIIRVPAVVECAAGHRTTLSGELDVRCPHCPEPTTVVAGEEFRVLDIDVE